VGGGAAAHGRAEAMLVFDDPMILSSRARLVALAAKRRLPTMYGTREFPDTGGLLSNLLDQYRRTATYVDKILKGAKPSDLPIELPTKFDLVINLKTAKALGLTIPPSLLQRADQVIE
jgi:putative ABC transport system substrate-binding protein